MRIRMFGSTNEQNTIQRSRYTVEQAFCHSIKQVLNQTLKSINKLSSHPILSTNRSFQQTSQLGSFTLRKTWTATCHQDQYQDDYQHEDRDENNVPRVLPPHLVLQSTSVRIEDESLLVQVAGLIGELLDLLSTAENLV